MDKLNTSSKSPLRKRDNNYETIFQKKNTFKIITEVINVLNFRNQIVTISNSLEISKI